MKPLPLLAVGLFGILTFTVSGAEPDVSLVSNSPADPAGSREGPLLEGIRARDELSFRVLEGKMSVEDALDALRAEAKPYGLGLDTHAEFALAAMDVGYRLLSRRRPVEAEPFFRAAESDFGKALSDVSIERSVSDRVMLLRNRALVRADRLGRFDEAREDFDEAIRLRPDNKAIVRQRDAVMGGRIERSREQTRD